MEKTINRIAGYLLAAPTLLTLLALQVLLVFLVSSQKAHGVGMVELRQTLDRSFWKGEPAWPKTMKVGGKTFGLKYTFDEELGKFIKKLLRKHRSDYTSVVVIDNNNGNILNVLGYMKRGNTFNNTLPFSSTHPSASIFKIITSAELLENSDIGKDSVFNFRGRASTLYKYQLTDKKNIWTKYSTLEDAFARSNNVVFGKAAVSHIDGLGIFRMANKFGFNNNLLEEVTLSKSIFYLPKDNYHFAELASGFNRETMMSVVHGAVIASIVANDGVLKYPRLIERVTDLEKGSVVDLWKNGKNKKRQRQRRVYDQQTARELAQMMEATIRRGTARRAFRRLIRKKGKILLLGGKTGSITGGVPHGKRDWFVAYGRPRSREKIGADRGISICVMNINLKKWYVKASFLAKKIIEYHYRQHPFGDKLSDVKDHGKKMRLGQRF